jgi:hypothetical protein
MIAGVPVTVPVRTAFDIARFGTLLEGVTALDTLCRGRPDFLEQLAGYARERPRWRGVPRVRAALSLASPRTRSPRESALRLFWVLTCRLPPPEVNAVIRDADGFLLGMTDLLDPRCGLIAEYDGSGHREATRHALDNAREEALENAGLTVVRVGGPDLGRFRSRTRLRLITGHRRAEATPRGLWSWEPGPMPSPVRHW